MNLEMRKKEKKEEEEFGYQSQYKMSNISVQTLQKINNQSYIMPILVLELELPFLIEYGWYFLPSTILQEQVISFNNHNFVTTKR